MPIKKKAIKKQTAAEKEAEAKRIDALHNFYKPEFDKEKRFKGIKFKKVQFLELLKSFGFFCYDLDVYTSKFVNITNNLIKEVPEKFITSFFIKYIDSLPDREITKGLDEGETAEEIQIIKKVTAEHIKEAVLSALDCLFKTKLLYCLTPDSPIEILQDEKDCKFFFYNNGFLKVTAENIDFLDYSENTKFIWANQILNRDYQEPDQQTSSFEKFIYNICRHENEEKTAERFLSFRTIIGYLMHNFTKCKLFAPILTDSRIDSDGEANGRTGKTLALKGIGKMLNKDEKSAVYIDINGKSFDLADKHRYDKASLDTQLIHLNDCYKYFDIESLFNDITDGVQAKKLYENAFTIYPKIVISTNKTIKIEGESAKDRVIMFELSDYYSAQKSPLTEFNHWFFDEWEPEEWRRFDFFMINCMQLYFKHGLKRTNTINLDYRMLLDHTDKTFVNWFKNMLSEFDDDGQVNIDQVIIDKNDTSEEFLHYNEKKVLYNNFTTAYPEFLKLKYFNQNKFTKWIKNYIKLIYKETVIIKEKRSNSKDLINFKYV